MTVDVHTGEIVAHMSAASARSLTDEIRQTLTSAHDKLLDAWRGRADLALGYDSWDAYCAGEFAGQRMVRLDREQRREIVASMRAEGMSTRAIGSALGVGHQTVQRDLPTGPHGPVNEAPVVGVNGKTYTPRQPEPAVVEAEIVDDPEADGRDEDAPPSTPRATPEAQERHDKDRAERQQREDHSRDLARVVWLLGEMSRRVDAAEHMASIWQQSQDVYPKPTTAERLRQSADFLHDLADRWHS